MEKLINILPNIITNEDASWLGKKISEPDALTKEILMRIDNKLATFGLGAFIRHPDNTLKDHINNSADIDELISLAKDYFEDDNLTKVFKDIKQLFNCEGVEATTLIWTASIMNKLNNAGATQENIMKLFAAVCYSSLTSKTTLREVGVHLEDFTKSQPNFEKAARNYLSLAYLNNDDVLDTDDWFDFDKFEMVKLVPTMEINSQEDLILALKDANNYAVALEYVKNNYLSETDKTADGYCENDYSRNYKATLIIAVLASESYKHLDDFDSNNFIGLNLTAEIIALQKKLNGNQILAGLSNEINKYDDQAGRIAAKILGREHTIDATTPRFKVPRAEFKTGNIDDYIKAQLNAFEKLIEPNIEFYKDLTYKLSKLENRFSKKKYKYDPDIEEVIEATAAELDINEQLSTNADDNVRFHENITLLKAKTLERLKEMKFVIDIYHKLRRKQKYDLADIQTLDLINDKSLIGNNVVISSNLHEVVIKDFYAVVEDDPILKGDKEAKYRIKTPKMILADIKKRALDDPYLYPNIAKLLGRFTLTTKESIDEVIEGYYVNEDGSVNKEYEEVYRTIKDKNATLAEKHQAIEQSPIYDDDKDKLNELVDQYEKDRN